MAFCPICKKKVGIVNRFWNDEKKRWYHQECIDAWFDRKIPLFPNGD